MKVDILVKCYNRPHCTHSLLDALAQQEGHGLKIQDVVVFQDGPKTKQPSAQGDYRAVQESRIVAEGHSFPTRVAAAEHNLNANGNCARFWQHMTASDADAFLTFEDDVLPGPAYFAAIEKLLILSKQDPEIGMVSAMGMLGHSASTQARYAKDIMPMGYVWGVHRWGWAALKERIMQMAPYVMGYFDHCQSIGYLGDSVNGAYYQALVKPWLEAKGFYQDQVMFGYDVSYDLAAYAIGLINISSYASFGVSKGDTGTSFSREVFETYRYHQTRCIDRPPAFFKPFSDEQKALYFGLIDRFHRSWMEAAQKPNQASSGMSRPQLIDLFYRRILKRSMVQEDIVGHRIHLLVDDVNDILPYEFTA